MQDIATPSFWAVNPTEVVRRFIGPNCSAYDYVLIDCPPDLGFITQHGLEVGNHHVIPTIPDGLST